MTDADATGCRERKEKNMKTTIYQADCDQFDNHVTGYYASAEEAIAAFWSENTFSEREAARVVVYTRETEIDPSAPDADTLDSARNLLASGRPSPALDMAL